MRTSKKVALKRALTLAILMVAALTVSVGSAAASPLDLVDQVVSGGADEHCVADIEGEAADGEAHAQRVAVLQLLLARHE